MDNTVYTRKSKTFIRVKERKPYGIWGGMLFNIHGVSRGWYEPMPFKLTRDEAQKSLDEFAVNNHWHPAAMVPLYYNPSTYVCYRMGPEQKKGFTIIACSLHSDIRKQKSWKKVKGAHIWETRLEALQDLEDFKDKHNLILFEYRWDRIL